MFLLTIPSTIGLMILAKPIMSVVYQHGKFNAMDADQAGGALRFYAIGLAGYAALKVLVNAFYALDRRKTPMFVSCFAVALNLLLNWIFTFQLHWGHLGLAFSTGCVATFNFLVLYVLMYRQLDGLEVKRMVVLLAKTLAAGAALAAVCLASTHWLLADWPSESFLPKVSALLATVIGGGVVFAVSGVLLRIEELNELIAMVRRRMRSGR
jgi:putative peptidoglycan lipid II flippase